MAHVKPLFFAVVTLSIAFVLHGCSLIGYGIGSSSDSSKPDEYTFPPDAVYSLERGADVIVTLRDSTNIRGTFVGIDTMPIVQYTNIYSRFMSDEGMQNKLPTLGDTLLLYSRAMGGARTRRVQFLGFESGLLCVQGQGPRSMSRLWIKYIDSLTFGGGTTITGRELSDWMGVGKIPYFSSLVLSREEDQMKIPLQTIELLHQPTSKNAKWIGLGVGAAIDIAIIIAVATNPPQLVNLSGMKF